MSNIHALIIAAGSSSRLGRPKQLVEIEGQTLLERVCRAALSIESQGVTVALGAFVEAIRPTVEQLPVRIVVNENWATGMGSTIAFGISQLPEDAEAVLLLLSDQPKVTGAYLKNLLEKWESAKCPILASEYGGSYGPPAIFDKAFFPELAALQGQQGAKKIMEKYRSQLELVAFPEGILDIDTPEDLHKMRGEGRGMRDEGHLQA